VQPEHRRVPFERVQRSQQLSPIFVRERLSPFQRQQRGVEPRQLAAALVAEIDEELG
jgi:hypothetical protein